MTKTFKTGAVATTLTLSKFSPRIYDIVGYNANSSPAYLQIHAAATLAGNEVPYRSLLIPASNGFKYNWPEGLDMPQGTTTVILAISTTEATYTAAVTGADFEVNVEAIELPVKSSLLTTVGPTATTAGVLQIWAEGTAIHTLTKLTVVETGGDASFVRFYKDDSCLYVCDELPAIPLAANATIILYFGNNGVNIFERLTAAGVLTSGLTVGVAKAVAGYAPASTVYDGAATITGVYR